jgi:hypothetical protein
MSHQSKFKDTLTNALEVCVVKRFEIKEPRIASFIDILPAKVIAEQLTLQDFEMFAKIRVL